MYEIIIKKTDKKTVIKSVYYSGEELNKLGLEAQKDSDGGLRGGYTTREIDEDVTTEIYSQKVDDLNIKTVIDAVNSLNNLA